ncbi:MAG: carboxylesterase family protein [Flavobacteriaceae bacterium]
MNRIVVLFLLTVFILSCTNTNQLTTTVRVEQGLIRGSKEGEVFSFKGIPYAEAPINELRWKAPQVKSSWEGELDCTAFGPSPMQASPQPFFMWSEEFLIPPDPISEDCLYLNVWTAAKTTKDNKAVIVWINGGGFSSGSGSVPIYDGVELAKKDVVYVSINYREGIFGFLAHPELTDESPNNSSGNYGLLDQIAALKWVKSNISNFGGDPNNITIAGQSAGSMSVSYLIASSLAQGLFQKAILQSGGGILSTAPAKTASFASSIAVAEQAGMALVEQFEAASVEELRSLPAEKLLSARGRVAPNIDGYVLPKNPAQIFKAAENNPVSILTGWNENEGLTYGRTPTIEAFKETLQEGYGELADGLVEMYQPISEDDLKVAHADFARDQLFASQNYTFAQIVTSQGQPAFVYRFIRDVPAEGDYVGFKAFHTAEVPYALATLDKVDRPWEESDYSLSDVMTSFWTNFAKTGDPNGPELPQWDAFSSSNSKVMYFDEVSTSKPLHDAKRLDFFYQKLYLDQE